MVPQFNPINPAGADLCHARSLGCDLSLHAHLKGRRANNPECSSRSTWTACVFPNAAHTSGDCQQAVKVSGGGRAEVSDWSTLHSCCQTAFKKSLEGTDLLENYVCITRIKGHICVSFISPIISVLGIKNEKNQSASPMDLVSGLDRR